MKRGYHGWTKTALRWPNRIHSRVDAYPLVGFAFMFLVILMTSTPTVSPSWSVDLPRTLYARPIPRAVREDAQIVGVSRDGQLYYRNQRVRIGDLPDQIRESIRNGADRKIYVRADTRARYGDIERVLDEIRKTGVQNVCFFAERVSP